MFGVLAIDKPAGWTSRDVVNRIQKLIRPTKVGHTGTLDPMATGVLLLPVGPATRLTEFAHAMPKCYEAEFLLGHNSDTLDATGRVDELLTAPLIHRDQWLLEMENWKGVLLQRPPIFSAIQVGGRRAYELARKGEHVDLSPREITIHQLELLDFDYPNVAMRIRCSTGTYIRCLGADIASSLGSGALMSRLVRTEIGPFSLDDCSQVEDLDSCEAVANRLASPVDLLPAMQRVVLSEEEWQEISHGRMLEGDRGIKGEGAKENGLVAAVDSAGRLIAVLVRKGHELRPVRVFHS